MSTFEEDLLKDAEDDRLTVEYIQNYLPQELKDKFTEEELYYFIDVIGEYYVDLLDKHNGDEDIDIDVEEVAKYVAKQAKKDKMGDSTLKTSVGLWTANWSTESNRIIKKGEKRREKKICRFQRRR